MLPAALCNQIAAGEVVERPASVVKELVENSLDAAATQIDVCLENGGQSLIRVQDNGLGIARDQLELAVTRHATSKISCLEDLDRISSYGFRGEALPSIASVSRLKIISRRKDAASPDGMAGLLEIEHGVISRTGGASLPQGTLIEARDLFSNTPARLKFLKSPATELKKAQNWLVRLALASLAAGFSFSAGDREILRFLPDEDLRLRLSKIWPYELTEELLPVQAVAAGIRLEGLAAPPQLRLAKPDRVLFYVNGRPVNDKRLMSAVREAYKGRLISREYPQLVLFVNINPLEIDVNAHPAKTEVRFRNEGALFSAVAAAMGQAFKNLSVFSICSGFGGTEEKGDDAGAGFWNSLKDPPVIPRAEKGAPAGEWLASFPGEALEEPPCVMREAETSFHGEACLPEPREPLIPAPPPGEKSPRQDQPLFYMGQAASTYLVLSDSSGALLLLDQHAAHERVLFHRLASGNAESGINLIIPLELRVAADQKELVKKLAPVLSSLGFKQRLDGGKLVVKCIPPQLTRGEARDFLLEILEGRKENPQDLYTSMACRGAIKAGQKLTSDEAYELLRQWQKTPMAEFCPHGRPCVLRWDAAALEKMFKRR